jgi:hypothetical protein
MSINFNDHDLTTSGIITAASGYFTTLTINNSNFNSSVSGLLPTIANSGDNRVLTSTGSTVGINAESNLIFNDETLFIGDYTGDTGGKIVLYNGNAGDGLPSITFIDNNGNHNFKIYMDDSDNKNYIKADNDHDLIISGSNNNSITLDNFNGKINIVSSGVTISSSGTNVPLTITNDGTGNSFVVNDVTGDSTPFIIDSTGRVGIGTTSPGAELEVADSSSDNDVRINLRPNGSTLSQVGASSTQTFISSVGARSFEVYTNDISRLIVTASGNVGIGTTTPTFVNNTYSGLHIHAATATSLKLTNTTTGQTSTDGFELLQDSAGNAYIWNRENTNISIATSGTSRITITNDGKVGIGVTPASAGSSALQVRGDLDIFGNGSDRSITYNMGVGDDGITGWYRSKIAFIPSSATNKISQHIAFFNKDGDLGGSTLTERMRITTDGNVGIGTSSPPELLSVFKDTNAGRTSILIDNLDQRLKMSCYYESGVGQYAEIQSTNNAETGHQNLILNRQGASVGIGVNPSAKLHIYGAGTTTNYYANGDAVDHTLYLQSSSNSSGAGGQILFGASQGIFAGIKGYIVNGTGPAGWLMLQTRNTTGNVVERFRITETGEIYMFNVYDSTVGATNRDLYIDSNYKIGYVSSIRASKTHISSLNDVSWLSSLNPVSYYYRKRDNDNNYTEEPDGIKDYGLIAEEVEQIAPELCFYDIVDDEPQLRGVTYSKLITPMLKYIQILEKRIIALENQLK